MSRKDIAFVVLAAGEGTRLKCSDTKPLVPLLGRRLIDYPIRESQAFLREANLSGDIFVVTGHRKDEVEKYLNESYQGSLKYAVQEPRLGTGHALQCYFNQTPEAKNYTYTFIICSDTPLLTRDVFKAMYDQLLQTKVDALAVSYMETSPHGYGRMVHGKKGFKIVEEKDADEATKQIKEVNSALYVIKTSYTSEHLFNLKNNNKSGEFYLTDLFQHDRNIGVLCYQDRTNFIGINTLEQLQTAENYLLQRKITELVKNGVRFLKSETAYVDYDVEIGAGTLVYPQAFIKGKTVIGKNCEIGLGSHIADSKIEERAIIKPYCSIDQSIIKSEAQIGPFAHLRPESNIGEGAKIGNFVEIKKSKLDRKVKVSHLSYVGDAEIGEDTNIGCGFITCNYDGVNKHKTIIGKDVFVGSDSQAVAPIEIGDGCFIASGTTITQSMAPGSFAISRIKQTTKEGMAHRFIKKKK